MEKGPPLPLEAPAIEQQLGALINPHLDVFLDRCAVGRRDNRPVMGGVVGGDADAQIDRFLPDAGDELILSLIHISEPTGPY